MSRRTFFERICIGGLIAAILCFVVGGPALACDTPVYRYAMYRWFPAPYEVYCFHQDKLDETAEAVRSQLEEFSEDEEVRANIIFLPVDLNKDKELKSVPPDVKEAWEKLEEKKFPNYLVSSPRGRHLLMGSLEAKELAAIVDSPMRQQVGKFLKQGKAGVYVFVPGEDEKANKEAEDTVKGVVADVASGKIMIYTPPTMYPPPGEDEEEEAQGPRTQFGYLKVTRDDAKEKWFMKSLLALEPDLPDCKEPMLFLVFGRGRALFSCLGKGIYRDNLLEDIDYITGACSCMVKEQNPGMDLCMRYDWDAVAETLYNQYGAEEGSGYHFGGDTLFPELIIPSETEEGSDTTDDEAESKDDAEATDDTADDDSKVDPPAKKTDADAATEDTGAQDMPADQDPSEPEVADKGEDISVDDASTVNVVTDTVASDQPSDDSSVASDSPSGDPVESVTDDPDGGDRIASLDQPAADETQTAKGRAFRGVLWVGVVLVFAFVVLFGATFIVLRPK